jgi:phenylacetate-CoA ligase
VALWWRQIARVPSVLRAARMSRDELVALRDRRLRLLVAHAYDRVPYYRRLFDAHGLHPSDIRTADDLAAVPITTKDDLRAVPLQDTVTRGLDPEHLVVDRTSGISGDPSAIRRSRLERRLTVLFWYRALRQFGLKVRDRRATVTYCGADHRTSRTVLGRALDRAGIYRNLLVHSAQPAADILRTLRQYRPHFLSGYTGTILHVAQEAGRPGGRPIRPRAVTVGAETLTDAMRETIGNAFGAPVYVQYGSHEFNLIAWECPETGELHACDDALVVEVLTDGRPAARGERGELVATNLYSFAVPFIRYRLGDIVTQGSPRCACGQPFSTIRAIEGRTIEGLTLPGGRWLHASEIVRPVVRKSGWIRRMQFVQEREDRIALRLVPLSAPPPGELQRIKTACLDMLGQGVDFRLDVVPEISPGPGGKYRLVVTGAESQ